jgi:hypothetical protein
LKAEKVQKEQQHSVAALSKKINQVFRPISPKYKKEDKD